MSEKDYRMSFIRDVETALANRLPKEQVAMVSDIMIKVLSDYEIMERCTDLAPIDGQNEKILKRYSACLMVDGKSEKTIYQYDRTLKRLIEAIPKPVTEMGAYDIRFFLAMEKERGVSNRTLENTRANLSAFFQWMSVEEIIPKNPLQAVNPIKYVDEIKTAFSDVEIDALRSACKTLKERALIEILLTTGVRVSELSQMKVSDINLMDLSVHVKHGKGGKERYTYTTTVGAMHLKRYLDGRSTGSEWLFCNRSNDQLKPGGIRFILNNLSNRAGVTHVHPHRFRRTFATGLANRGMEIQEIQKLLGHSNINTTLEYVCIDNEKVKASYKRYIA